MPLTSFQSEIAKILAVNRSEDSHLAGASALHIEPNSLRYSNDLDYFNDTDKRVAQAYQEDETLLKAKKYSVVIEMRQPGYVRAQISKKKEATKIEWAYDSAWRFFPAEKNEVCGYRLHPIDLSINKVLTLAGRNEPRDFLDTLYVNETILSLGALCWAAVGKDPGFNPRSLLELLKRRGKFREEDFERLQLVKKLDIETTKSKWLAALAEAESFIMSRPPSEVGCLYFSLKTKKVFSPSGTDRKDHDYQVHYGKLGGVIPKYEGE